jgi:putative adhesin
VAWEDDDSPSTTSARVTHRSLGWGPVFGALLVAVGVAGVLHQVLGRGVSVIPLTIGILLLVRAQSGGGHYPMLVIGAVLTGSGLGNFAGDIVGGGMGDALGSLGTACGFFWLASTDRRRSSWAMIPAAILALIGIGQLGFQLSTLSPGHASWLVPAGVVVAGIMLLGSHRVHGPLRIAGFVFVGAAALSLISGNHDDHPKRVFFAPSTVPKKAVSTLPMPGLGDRELVIRDETGNVTVTVGDGRAIGRDLSLGPSGDRQVTLDSSPTDDLRVEVPAGTHLNITTLSGDVHIAVPNAVLTIDTQEGDVEVTDTASMLSVTTTEGDVSASLGQLADTASARITTSSGDVELRLTDDPTVAAGTGSGDISASGFGDDHPHGHAFAHSGSHGKLEIDTDGGEIHLRQVA